MGQSIDVPITEWQEMFLPSEIGRRIAAFTYPDGEGRPRPLVSAVDQAHTAPGRPAVLEVPRKQWPRELLAGLALAALFALTGSGRLKQRYPRFCRIFGGLAQSALGLVFGIAGSVLFFLTCFTDHDYTWHNTNVWFVNPLWLALVPLGIIAARGKKPAAPSGGLGTGTVLRDFWVYVCIAALATVAVRLLPGFYQQTLVTEALVLPFALVLAWQKAPR
jgi:hypothetical protein